MLALACGPSGPQGPTKLSGIGDSIMQGFDASDGGGLGEQTRNSFAQGTDPAVQSIFTRYRALSRLSQSEEFVSASGAEMVSGTSIPNAVAQAQRICSLTVRPDRIVLLLGGNDVCNRDTVAQLYPVATFRDALKAALDTLAAPDCGLGAGSWVHVVSMPRVDLLRAAGLQKDAAAGAPYCQAIWSSFQICRVVTGETRQSVLDEVGARIDAYNDGIAAEVGAADAAHGGMAGVHFTTDWRGPMTTHPGTSVGTVTFGPADISSLDCFHPSTLGQRKLACIAWETWELGSGDVASCL